MKKTKTGLPIVDQEQLTKLLSSKQPTLVLGLPGIGKTHVMKSNLQGMISSHDMMTTYSEGGMEALKGKLNTSIVHYSYLFIDDIGTEQEASHYGNKLDVVQWLIYTAYEKKIPLYMTSNLNLEELEVKYGPRVVDRLKEMCYIVVLEGQNFRQPKFNQNVEQYL